MQKILILGNSGAGKSTLAIKLAKILNFPVYHLDNYLFNSDWTQVSSQTHRKNTAFMFESSSWIIEGKTYYTLDRDLNYPDTIIFLDIGLTQCLNNVLKRRRTESQVGWPKYLKTNTEPALYYNYFLNAILRFNPERHKAKLQKVSKVKTVYWITSYEMLDNFLQDLENSQDNLTKYLL